MIRSISPLRNNMFIECVGKDFKNDPPQVKADWIRIEKSADGWQMVYCDKYSKLVYARPLHNFEQVEIGESYETNQ
jgi:hypothetical protein